MSASMNPDSTDSGPLPTGPAATNGTPTDVTPTDRALGDALIALPGVSAVFIGGSRATGTADEASDTDLYALHEGRAPDAAHRLAALAPLADGGEVVEETAWGLEDHLLVGAALYEVIYLSAPDLRLDEHDDGAIGPTGYTTAFLHTVEQGVPVCDPHGVLAALQERLRRYPEATRHRILTQLSYELSGYLGQLRKAQARHDWTGVTNRRAAFQVAWFDLAFALNRRYHPGEKRLLHHLTGLSALPDAATQRWTQASLARADDPALPDLLEGLADDLLALLADWGA